eukprot:SAG31_NODE_9637_length_1248_cov_0.907746_2_plen_159_part_00
MSPLIGSTHGKPITLKQGGENLTLVASGATAADVELTFALEAPHGSLDVVVTALGQKIDLHVEANHSTARIAINRTPSGRGAACAGAFPLPAAVTEIALRVLLDGVSLEVFAAQGRGVCSYATTSSLGSAVVVATVATSTSDVIVKNATVWQMSAIDA